MDVAVLRELLLGTHRFNEFQRALSRISPSLLAKRLKQLEGAGIVVRKALQGRYKEYSAVIRLPFQIG